MLQSTDMENLENVFITFRNQSFDETTKLNHAGLISDKEKSIFKAVAENAANVINNIITEFKASKVIAESDFNWMMQLYTFVCLQELYDILDSIKRDVEGGYIKNTLDVNAETIKEHLGLVIGGEDIKTYMKSSIKLIESMEKDSKNYNEYIVGRIGTIITWFENNKVAVDKTDMTKIVEFSEKSFQNSLMNFTNICLR